MNQNKQRDRHVDGHDRGRGTGVKRQEPEVSGPDVRMKKLEKEGGS